MFVWETERRTGRPVGPLVAKRAWNRRTVFSGLCDAWIRADCSNSSSCWERLASSDSKTSTCKNKTRNLCFPPPSLPLSLSLPLPPCSAALGGNVFWKLALIGTSELEMTQTRPRAAPSGYSRCRRCQEALKCCMCEWDREREAVLPSDRIMSTSTHHTQTP